MAEAVIVISSESDAEDLCKGSGKVRNAASEGILSFFSVLPAGELPRPSHTRRTAPGRPRKATTMKRPVGRSRKLPPPADSDSDEIITPHKKTRVTINPKPRSPTRTHYSSYNMLQKQRVVAYAKENTLAAAARKYFVAESTLCGWMKIQFEDIQERGQSLKMTKRRSGGGRKLTYPSEIDEEILAWVLSNREKQQAVTIGLIQAQGRKVITPHSPNFVASRGWAERFMPRHSLSLRMKTSLSQ